MKAFLIAMVAAALSAQAQAPAPGTYAIAVCKGAPCSPADSSRALAWGRLILFPQPIDLSTLPDSARRLLRGLFLRHPANGCTIMQHRPRAETYAGVTRGNYWEPDTATGWIRVSLYRSPDALHDARLRISRDRLDGTGRSFGAGAAEVHWAPDTVVAIRLGPPELQQCIAATRKEWRRIQGFRDSLRSRPPT